jgi:hypothetical protein
VATLKTYRGDTRTFSLTVKRQNLPVDLGGCLLTFTAKRAIADADAAAVVQKAIGSGLTVTDEAGGLAEFTVESADTDGLTTVPVTLEWDVQLVEADGTVTTVARGQWQILADVTRAT